MRTSLWDNGSDLHCEGTVLFSLFFCSFLFTLHRSRLFFRAAAKHIKLVAVDEPSASLDPKMEYELFESLRAISTTQGKTMVNITHLMKINTVC